MTVVPGNRSQVAPLAGAVAVFSFELTSPGLVDRIPPKKTRRPSGVASRSGVFEMAAQPVWMTLGGDAVPFAAIAS